MAAALFVGSDLMRSRAGLIRGRWSAVIGCRG